MIPPEVLYTRSENWNVPRQKSSCENSIRTENNIAAITLTKNDRNIPFLLLLVLRYHKNRKENGTKRMIFSKP